MRGVQYRPLCAPSLPPAGHGGPRRPVLSKGRNGPPCSPPDATSPGHDVLECRRAECTDVPAGAECQGQILPRLIAPRGLYNRDKKQYFFWKTVIRVRFDVT